jgi:hypothetical protein
MAVREYSRTAIDVYACSAYFPRDVGKNWQSAALVTLNKEIVMTLLAFSLLESGFRSILRYRYHPGSLIAIEMKMAKSAIFKGGTGNAKRNGRTFTLQHR